MQARRWLASLALLATWGATEPFTANAVVEGPLGEDLPDDSWFEAARTATTLYAAAENARSSGNASGAIELYERAATVGVGEGAADALAALARMNELGWGRSVATANDAPGAAAAGDAHSVNVYTATTRGAAPALGSWAVQAWERVVAALSRGSSESSAGILEQAADAATRLLGAADSSWGLALAFAPPAVGGAAWGGGGAPADELLVPQVRPLGWREAGCSLMLRAPPPLPFSEHDARGRAVPRGGGAGECVGPCVLEGRPVLPA